MTQGNRNHAGRGSSAGTPTATRGRAWLQLGLCVLLVWAFVFHLVPHLSKIEAVRTIQDSARAKGIDATALYYTEVPEFSDADCYVRDAMRY